jgi:hypothetical protein
VFFVPAHGLAARIIERAEENAEGELLTAAQGREVKPCVEKIDPA